MTRTNASLICGSVHSCSLHNEHGVPCLYCVERCLQIIERSCCSISAKLGVSIAVRRATVIDPDVASEHGTRAEENTQAKNSNEYSYYASFHPHFLTGETMSRTFRVPSLVIRVSSLCSSPNSGLIDAANVLRRNRNLRTRTGARFTNQLPTAGLKVFF